MLKLDFQLGNHNDLHCDHHHVPQPDVHYHSQDLGKNSHGGQHKGPAKREKDCARAAAYQAAQLRTAAPAVPSAMPYQKQWLYQLFNFPSVLTCCP